MSRFFSRTEKSLEILDTEKPKLIRPLAKILIFNITNLPTNEALKKIFAKDGITKEGVVISRSSAPGATNRIYHLLRKTPLIRGIDYMLKDYQGCEELNRRRKRIKTIKIFPEKAWKGDANVDSLVNHIQLELEDVHEDHLGDFEKDEEIANQKPSMTEKAKAFISKHKVPGFEKYHKKET